MVDPVVMLLEELEHAIARLPSAVLAGPHAAKGALEERFKEFFGRRPPPGYLAFIARHDGGVLGPDVRLLSWSESWKRAQEAERGRDPAGERGGQARVEGNVAPRGLWPILERGQRLFALDAESAGDPEWPVVELADRSVDRAGTSFLRFMQALVAELGPLGTTDMVTLARELTRRDPGMASHWVELLEELDRAGRHADMDEILPLALRASSPPGPALAFMAALRALDLDDRARAQAALEDALTLEPLNARDDDARLDAAAVSIVLAQERDDRVAVARGRDVLGSAASSTGAYWRGEAMRASAEGQLRRADVAAAVVRALLPEDTDILRIRPLGGNPQLPAQSQLPSQAPLQAASQPPSQPPSDARLDPRLTSALQAIADARDALDRGAVDEATERARTAVADRPDLGVCHAVLAEALNAKRDRGALDSAQRATELNPALVEAWRELGDAQLEARQAVKAEEAYRKAIARDTTYGFGYAKLAQALLEQGRTLEALEAISAATERGGDPFFLAAVRGDILAEMSRHPEAAEAYDLALRLEPEDHWVLHQAAIEHGRTGNEQRAVELFEEALRNDREGCHQTLVDYGDLLRRLGRIGDAVRLYRKAVAASPSDSEWRQMLREAERELMAAPN